MKWLLLLAFSSTVLATSLKIDTPKDIVKLVFKDYTKKEVLKINDPINDEPTNTSILKIYKGDQHIGFVRQVTTSTGCNDGCLPVIFDLYYDQKGTFLKLLSTPGLTKKHHKPFTPNDYIQLEMIILQAPEIFNSVAHPKQMVDAISGATTKIYEPYVIKQAAYTTLRVHLFHQHTSKYIKNLLKP